MTDTQVMAALEPTQADINAANSFFNRMDNPIRHAMLVQAFARHRIASSPAATLPDCIVNGDVEAWLFSHPDRDGDMEAGRLELFNFRMGYAAPVTPPAVDAELREIVRPFAEAASAILAEAPADADSFALFTDCQRNTYAVSMDELRALSALATPPSVPAQGEEKPVIRWKDATGQIREAREASEVHSAWINASGNSRAWHYARMFLYAAGIIDGGGNPLVSTRAPSTDQTNEVTHD